MFTQKTIVSSLYLLAFLLLTTPLQAVEVVDVKPSVIIHNNEIAPSYVAPIELLKKSSKKKKRWFQRVKEKFLQKKLARLLPQMQFDSTICDIIVLRNGEEIAAKVTEVNIGAILYKKCEITDGPNYSILKSKVSTIKYANGQEDVFNKNSNNNTSSNDINYKPRTNTWSVGFTLGILLGLLGVLIAAVIYKDTYERKRAVSGALVGLLARILAVVLFYLYLLSVV